MSGRNRFYACRSIRSCCCSIIDYTTIPACNFPTGKINSQFLPQTMLPFSIAKRLNLRMADKGSYCPFFFSFANSFLALASCSMNSSLLMRAGRTSAPTICPALTSL